jgi:hypothetical protein
MAPVEHTTDTAKAEVEYSKREFARLFLAFLGISLVTAAGAFVARHHGLGWLEILLAIPAVFSGSCAVVTLAGIVAPGPVNRWL